MGQRETAISPSAAPITPETGLILHQCLRERPDRYALFLDIDGTLIDLAATPDGITVPAGLGEALGSVSARLGGALALVTGRGLAYADQLFAPQRFPLAGLHGTERRDAEGAIFRADPTASFIKAKAHLRQSAETLPGILIEDKGAAIAAHYRQAPVLVEKLEEVMTETLHLAGKGYELQRGKMVFEIRPDMADKGRAVEAFLSSPPFQGRLPITIGDDLTDEAMFAVANRLGGLSIKVGDGGAEKSAATHQIPDPDAVRAVLFALAGEVRSATGEARP
ncbi:trehalose-phosphatase [Rhizobium paknamense]|uniref:Trehalose 6-phosphate phosphatase n=1 Tax=Rhizobium paknamense TaxID=1206817 RepID=A0ABU0ICZ2_9HYPH|nr:trehalose-phosphatase [Rhizobium paknamense]MDQ0455300.1 trehalose 6-phosphate phosphatase [Rhizobium paknamense]